MAVKRTLTGNLFLNKPNAILITPYDGDSKGTTTYALDSIVADSTSITQDEADRNEIECETRDENLYESIVLGSYQFTADNADWQQDLVTAVLGFTTNTDGALCAPSSYVEKFAEIEIQFGDSNSWESDGNAGSFKASVVLPKVLLSSAATMESLKTSLGTMTVAGTAYSAQVGDVITPFYISKKPVTKLTA